MYHICHIYDESHREGQRTVPVRYKLYAHGVPHREECQVAAGVERGCGSTPAPAPAPAACVQLLADASQHVAEVAVDTFNEWP